MKKSVFFNFLNLSAALFFCVLNLFVFAGCNETVSGGEIENSLLPVEKDSGNLSIKLPSAGAGRAVTGEKYFTVVLASATETDNSMTKNGVSGETISFTGVKPGNYKITGTAFDDEAKTLLFAKGEASCEVSAGVTSKVSLKMKLLSSGVNVEPEWNDGNDDSIDESGVVILGNYKVTNIEYSGDAQYYDIPIEEFFAGLSFNIEDTDSGKLFTFSGNVDSPDYENIPALGKKFYKVPESAGFADSIAFTISLMMTSDDRWRFFVTLYNTENYAIPLYEPAVSDVELELKAYADYTVNEWSEIQEIVDTAWVGDSIKIQLNKNMTVDRAVNLDTDGAAITLVTPYKKDITLTRDLYFTDNAFVVVNKGQFILAGSEYDDGMYGTQYSKLILDGNTPNVESTGPIVQSNGGNVKIGENVVLRNNINTQGGGAIHFECDNSARLEFYGIIEECHGKNSGGIYGKTSERESLDFQLSDGHIRNCAVRDGSTTGALLVYLENGGILIDNCNIYTRFDAEKYLVELKGAVSPSTLTMSTYGTGCIFRQAGFENSSYILNGAISSLQTMETKSVSKEADEVSEPIGNYWGIMGNSKPTASELNNIFNFEYE